MVRNAVFDFLATLRSSELRRVAPCYMASDFVDTAPMQPNHSQITLSYDDHLMNNEKRKRIENLLASGQFKGQKHQDRWVLFHVLPLMENGYFLDLAAADGITHSNTFVLEKHFGWDGLCIEPNPAFYNQLLQNRDCLTDSSVVSNKREILNFRIDNGQLGGIVAEDADNSMRIRGDQLPKATIISLEAKTINEILAHNNVPKQIDYFSLDIEGSEERVISTLDFSSYQFKCITIERPTRKVNEVLFDNRYVFVRNVRFDSFYVHPRVLQETKLECEKFEQVPEKDW